MEIDIPPGRNVAIAGRRFWVMEEQGSIIAAYFYRPEGARLDAACLLACQRLHQKRYRPLSLDDREERVRGGEGVWESAKEDGTSPDGECGHADGIAMETGVAACGKCAYMDGTAAGMGMAACGKCGGVKEQETALLAEARKQIREYFAGKRKEFHLPLRLYGTEFQLEDWKALYAIPYGETRTYGQVAASIGRPKASRAVGMANHDNPISIIVPCHRVIGSGGKLVGYGGGLDIKKALLELEQGRWI